MLGPAAASSNLLLCLIFLDFLLTLFFGGGSSSSVKTFTVKYVSVHVVSVSMWGGGLNPECIYTVQHVIGNASGSAHLCACVFVYIRLTDDWLSLKYIPLCFL